MAWALPVVPAVTLRLLPLFQYLLADLLCKPHEIIDTVLRVSPLLPVMHVRDTPSTTLPNLLRQLSLYGSSRQFVAHGISCSSSSKGKKGGAHHPAFVPAAFYAATYLPASCLRITRLMVLASAFSCSGVT